jgi:hypothetical protein
VSDETPAEIECPACGGDGCKECDNGYFKITQCPQQFIGQDLLSDIQVITASEHHLPVAGGLLDQSAWWFELRETLRREENRVKDEQSERRNR